MKKSKKQSLKCEGYERSRVSEVRACSSRLPVERDWEYVARERERERGRGRREVEGIYIQKGAV